LGGKIGIDATRKWASEGYTREWPELVAMSEPIKQQVSERWREYGFASAPAAVNSAGPGSRSLLSRPRAIVRRLARRDKN
ncbi:MAG: hypothetical protein WAW20_22575, partial [Anaerolineae bacterium]